MINLVDLEKRTVDWRVNKWPENDPFEVKVQSLEADEEIQLANYRYKAEGVDTPKAIVMFFHGYGSYTGKYGYYAKYLADDGFECLGFDFRGFGNTKGQSGHIDSWEQHMKDCWTYYDIVRAHYDNSIPIIGLGYSLGGGTVFNMAIERPGAFSALLQLAPFASYAWGPRHPFHYKAQDVYKFYPRIGLSPALKNPAPHMVHYYNDDLQVKAAQTAASIMALNTCVENISENLDKLINGVDMHISVGSNEAVIDRIILGKIVKASDQKVAEYFEYPGVDHYILNDGIWLEKVIEDHLSFLNKVTS